MPNWSITTSLNQTPSRIFALLCQPLQRLKLTPPEWNLRVKSGPAILLPGSRVAYQGKRWGLSLNMEVEVVEYQTDSILTENQIRGPFPHWLHQHHLQPNPDGSTSLVETITYEAPKGLLGQLLNQDRIEKDLEALYRWREPIIRELVLASITDLSQR